MNIDKNKLAALENAVAIIKGERIPTSVQRVRDLAREKSNLKKRAKLEDRVVKAARVAVDAGFRRRDKKTRPNSENIRTGQYEAENWREAFEEVRRLMKEPGARIGEVLADVRKSKCMTKVTEDRFRRKWYEEQERTRKARNVK
ncbi:MAG: hypothetical protein KBE52_02495 [Bilophila sp.]|nr:hypothetical protein [Bilophila sp.]